MSLILGLAAFVCLAVGAVLAFLFRRLIAGPKSLPVSVDWINDLSIARYRPMERLLSEGDFRFLVSQPGIDKKALRRMRTERRKIFRGYLACLSRDFSLVGAALRLMMMYSAQDRPDLAGILYKQQALFVLGMMRVQWRLVLHAFGLGNVDVSGLVRAMEFMRLELRQMIPAAEGAAA
ncbi:MAG TPA: hypothetical protein VKR61_05250 [Bryobacteraceae bacterium]|nr:hypothetical protein [Bryobacteraceae bacterium]